MKLNLGCMTDEIRTEGYLNIDDKPLDGYNADTYRQGNFESLDWLCEDETVEEISIKHSICRLPANIIEQALKNWTAKLEQNGILKIMILDAHLAAQMFAQDQLSLQEYQKMLFGDPAKDIKMQSVLDLLTLSSLIENAGLTIVTKRYDGLSSYIEATKK